jgi:hypothetical protein
VDADLDAGHRGNLEVQRRVLEDLHREAFVGGGELRLSGGLVGPHQVGDVA